MCVPFPLAPFLRLRAGDLNAQHRRSSGGADEAIEPVVVRPLGALAPFLCLPPVAEGRDVGLRAGHVLAEQVILDRLLTE